MKPNKLVIKKLTISNLNVNELSSAKGGLIFPTEETCIKTCIKPPDDIWISIVKPQFCP